MLVHQRVPSNLIVYSAFYEAFVEGMPRWPPMASQAATGLGCGKAPQPTGRHLGPTRTGTLGASVGHGVLKGNSSHGQKMGRNDESFMMIKECSGHHTKNIRFSVLQ